MADPCLEATSEEQQTTLRGISAYVPIAMVFLIIYAALLVFFRPDIMLAQTTTAGGDMGAHHYPAQFLIEELLPNFQVTGWSPGWYAGMPMFTFYLPFPFLLIAILNIVLPYTVAFKLATVAGIFSLPLAAYAFGALLRIRRPFPAVAAVFAVAFLFMESFNIYGANILSTLAGEFGYSISFSLAFVFLGTLSRGLERGKLDWLFALNVALLGIIVITHIVTVIALVAIVPSLLLIHRNVRAILYLGATFLVAFLLSGFWGIPFLGQLEWTAHMSWNQLEGIDDLLPADIRVVAGLAALGVAYAIMRWDVRLAPVLWTCVVMGVLYFTLPDGRLWNGRLLPYFYFGLHLFAAYGVAWLVRPFIVMTGDLLGLSTPVARFVYTPAIALGLVLFATLSSGTAASWIKWNYSGYEQKDSYPAYEEMLEEIDGLEPNGRVMWEHHHDVDKFGTSRAFELIPYWTRQYTMEGTLMESAFTAPYHFINQAELSVTPSHAIIGVDYPPRNAADGITHLQFMNIPYMLTATEEMANEVAADPRTEIVKEVDILTLFRVSDTGGYVEVAENEPVRVRTDDWRGTIVPWYKNMSALDVPVIWDRSSPGVDRFPLIDPEDAVQPPRTPLEQRGEVIYESLEVDKFTFETSAIGQPHWIKLSYFPNWEVDGADGPYVASPSFMMVIPTEAEVTLTYGRSWENTVGQLFTALGLTVVIGVASWETLGWWRNRRRGRPSPDA